MPRMRIGCVARGRLAHGALAGSVALGLALAAGGQAEGARSDAGQCRPAGSKTVLASPSARLYSKRVRERGALYNRGVALYGCRLRGGRPVRMALNAYYGGEDRSFDGERLAGRFAAVLSSSFFRVGPPRSELRVFNLRRGRRTLLIREPYVYDMELKASGAVAWTAGASSGSGFEVRKRDAGGPGVLDSGPGIVHDSLALSGSRLYWTNTSGAMSVRLR